MSKRSIRVRLVVAVRFCAAGVQTQSLWQAHTHLRSPCAVLRACSHLADGYSFRPIELIHSFHKLHGRRRYSSGCRSGTNYQAARCNIKSGKGGPSSYLLHLKRSSILHVKRSLRSVARFAILKVTGSYLLGNGADSNVGSCEYSPHRLATHRRCKICCDRAPPRASCTDPYPRRGPARAHCCPIHIYRQCGESIHRCCVMSRNGSR